MKIKYFFFYLLVFVSQLSFSQIPTITSFSPASAEVGDTVTITGTNFSTIPANNIVYFGAVKATITTATSTSLSVIVPASTTYEPITVTKAGLIGASKALARELARRNILVNVVSPGLIETEMTHNLALERVPSGKHRKHRHLGISHQLSKLDSY